jgi:hypothetical protein
MILCVVTLWQVGANVSKKSATSIFRIEHETGGTITFQKAMILIFSTMRSSDFILMVYESTSEILNSLPI